MNRSRAQQFMLMGAAAVLLAVVAFSANTALADKGGNGGPHNRGGQTAGSGTCVISPDPLAYGASGALNGTGFTPNTTVGYNVQGSGGTAFGFADVDGSGNVSMSIYGGWRGTNTVTFTGGPTCSFDVV